MLYNIFRYGFHRHFSTTTIWILHLALCDLLFSIFCAPAYFVPYLGYRYAQGYGFDTMCRASIIMAYMTVYNDWLLLSYIAVTRAINVTWRSQWKQFCSNKICLFLALCSPWLIQFCILLPWFVQV